MNDITTEVLKYNIVTAVNTDAASIVPGTQIPFTVPHTIPGTSASGTDNGVIAVSTRVLKYNISTTLV